MYYTTDLVQEVFEIVQPCVNSLLVCEQTEKVGVIFYSRIWQPQYGSCWQMLSII